MRAITCHFSDNIYIVKRNKKRPFPYAETGEISPGVRLKTGIIKLYSAIRLSCDRTRDFAPSGHPDFAYI
jgi:hypothetical protein